MFENLERQDAQIRVYETQRTRARGKSTGKNSNGKTRRKYHVVMAKGQLGFLQQHLSFSFITCMTLL